MNDVLKKIHDVFSAGQSVILATVMSGNGSGPRKPGAKMIFLQDGLTAGTIGGGALEAAVEKTAATLWTSSGAIIKSFTLKKDVAGGLEMVCGGTQRILLVRLAPTESHKYLLQRLFHYQSSADSAHLIIRLTGSGPEFNTADLGLIDSHNELFGLIDDNGVVQSLADTFRRKDIFLSNSINDTTYYIEKLSTQDSLYLFGAGHVARPVVEIASLVGFRTVVLDDREKFARRDNFPKADEVIVLDDFKDAPKNLSLNSDAYVVIITRGHSHDLTVLEGVLKTSATYIGMIGSRTKVAHCFKTLKEKGFSQDQLARIHAPIGLKIGSETPEEIAVSIVGQLIQVRSQLKFQV